MTDKLFYQSYGDHERSLVLLHSGGMAGAEWSPQIPVFSKRYRVLVPDLLGHGRSLFHGERLSMQLLGEAVLAMLDAEGIAKASFCGSSMGAAVTMWLALNYPQRVEKAVFYRITYHKNAETYAQTKMMAQPEYWQRFGLQKWLEQLHAPQGGTDAWKTVIGHVARALDPEYSDHHHRLEDFARLSMPVLLIVGDRDPVAPLAEILELYRIIPDAGLWVIPFATHITASNTWRSGAFAEEVIRFLARRSA